MAPKTLNEIISVTSIGSVCSNQNQNAKLKANSDIGDVLTCVLAVLSSVSSARVKTLDLGKKST